MRKFSTACEKEASFEIFLMQCARQTELLATLIFLLTESGGKQVWHGNMGLFVQTESAAVRAVGANLAHRRRIMAESRPVPTNLLSWPRVSGLLPDQKLLVYYLWANRFTSASGCYQLPVALASVELGLSELALNEAIVDFVKRELILLDPKTGEVFVCDWFRFHKFATTSQIRQLQIAFDKIESENLKKAVLHKINGLLANKTRTLTLTNSHGTARNSKRAVTAAKAGIAAAWATLQRSG